MKQYCRYCIYLCINDVPYCNAKEEFRSESSCKYPNKCKDFIFADVDHELQDAFGETNGYKPRHRKEQIQGQLKLEDLINE